VYVAKLMTDSLVCRMFILVVWVKINTGLRSSGILYSISWQISTDAMGQHISPILKGQAVQ